MYLLHYPIFVRPHDVPYPPIFCMIELYALILCLYFLLTKGACRIVFESQWYAIIMYSFPLLDLMGNLLQSSVYNLLMGWSHMWISLVFIVVEYPLCLIVAWLFPGMVSFDCFVFDICSSLLILLLAMIAPCGLLTSQLTAGNILMHCYKLILATTWSYHV